MELAQRVFEITYQVKFTNKKPVSVDKVVASLLAYEKLIKRVGPFIEEACVGVYVEDIEVLISKIESGSLIEKFLVRVIFQSQENYDQAVEVAAKMFENNKILTGAVCLGVAAYIGFGIRNAVISQSGPKAPAAHIEAQQGAIVQTGGTMNISEDAIAKILNKTRDKASLSKEAINAISPAQLEDGATVEFNDLTEIALSQAFIKESPKIYVAPEYQQDNEILLKTEIEIWASDQDSLTKSWAGIIPGKIEKRIKFKLDDAIDPKSLHGTTRIKADIMIVSTILPGKKEFTPKHVEILKIYKQMTHTEP